jgi:hypothetical protein
MTKGAKIAIGIVATLGIGVAVYYIVKELRKDSNQSWGGNLQIGGGQTTTTTTTTTTPTSTTGTKPANVDTLTFQRWVINTKGDKTILGGGGASGYGDDGIWGSKTQAAWDKYGSEFLGESTTETTTTETAIDQNKKNYSDVWYESQADKIYNALEPLADDEDAVRNVFSKLKSNADYWALKNAFGTRDGYDMKAWIKDDMWQWEIDRYCNKPMKANGLTVWIS